MSPLFVVVMVKPEKEGDKMSKREEYEARTEALLLPIMEERNWRFVPTVQLIVRKSFTEF